jgi:hypothetical protein
MNPIITFLLSVFILFPTVFSHSTGAAIAITTAATTTFRTTSAPTTISRSAVESTTSSAAASITSRASSQTSATSTAAATTTVNACPGPSATCSIPFSKFVVVASPQSVFDAGSACNSLGLTLATLTSANIREAIQVVSVCASPNSACKSVWVQGWMDDECYRNTNAMETNLRSNLSNSSNVAGADISCPALNIVQQPLEAHVTIGTPPQGCQAMLQPLCSKEHQYE